MVKSTILFLVFQDYFSVSHGSKWQRAVMLKKTKPQPCLTCWWQQQAKSSSWSQADHPQLLPVALHLSRALTALHLPGYMWFLLGQVLCIKVSGIYSSLTAGRSRHRKRLKFVCLPLQKLTQTLILWLELTLSSMGVHVCPRVFLLQHGEPPGASGPVAEAERFWFL